jgi:hypothetical protein
VAALLLLLDATLLLLLPRVHVHAVTMSVAVTPRAPSTTGGRVVGVVAVVTVTIRVLDLGPPRLEKYAPLLRAVRGRGRQGTRDGRETPLLDVGLDEHEAGLAEVDVHAAGPVGAHGGEEVLVLEAVADVLELLAVAGEEDGARAGPIADAYYVALDIGGPVRGWGKGLVVPAVAGGKVGC